MMIPMSITLSGIPDRFADEAAGKRTLAVRLGRKGALLVALGATVVTMIVTGTLGLTARSSAPVALPGSAGLTAILGDRHGA